MRNNCPLFFTEPWNNKWRATDSRCMGNGVYRGKRSVTSNGASYFQQDTYFFVYNSNHGSCEQILTSPQHAAQFFASKQDCDATCRNGNISDIIHLFNFFY